MLILPNVVSAQREKITLDGEWAFCIDFDKAGVQNNWFIKGLPSSKEKVQVPHTWELFNLPAVHPGTTFDFTMQNKWNDKGVIIIENQRGHVVHQQIVDYVGKR